jgi:1,3-beta-glucan synthase
MPLLAFARVYQFQLLWFYALAAWSWGGGRNMLVWTTSMVAVHFGTCCLLMTMHAALEVEAHLRREGVRLPFYASAKGARGGLRMGTLESGRYVQ